MTASSELATWLWQLVLHSAVAGLVLVAWQRRLRLQSGRSRRWLLALLLLLPPITASVPGRDGSLFRDQLAWFDSERVLLLPLWGPLRVAHLVLAAAAGALLVTLWQELWPARPAQPVEAAPDSLRARVQAVPGGSGWEVGVIDSDGIQLAVPRGFGSRKLLISRGALEGLRPEELDAALRHELAHGAPGREWVVRLLFAVRLLQSFNPVALWAFREYLVEVELACDREAVGDGNPRPLARALLAAYGDLDAGDLAARAQLRRRVERLSGGREDGVSELPLPTLALAGLTLALVLPWVV